MAWAGTIAYQAHFAPVLLNIQCLLSLPAAAERKLAELDPTPIPPIEKQPPVVIIPENRLPAIPRAMA